jgi:hypothetical protein
MQPGDPREWWTWDLAFTLHLELRMEERGFSESELRTMLEDATKIERSARPGRWIATTRLGGKSWTVVVEPDAEDRVLYVVTAFERSHP